MSASQKGLFKQRLQEPQSFCDWKNPWTFYGYLAQDNSIVIPWLVYQGLLAESISCKAKGCTGTCNRKVRNGAIDGFTMRCNINRNHEYSIRSCSFFEQLKFPLQDLLLFMKTYLDEYITQV